MSRYIPVEPEKWGEMVKAMAENRLLKAEVERLTAEVSYDKRCELHTDRLVAQFTQSEVERLKAEVERLKTQNAYLKGEEYPNTELGSMMPKYLLEHWMNENALLKAEVARLSKFNEEAMAHIAKEERKSWERLDMEQAENARLKAEVKRLRKVVKIADGAVDCVIQVHDYGFGKINTEYVSWLKRSYYAAKEGKQP